MIPQGNQYPGPAWNANAGRLFVDGLHGATRTIEAGDSPDGQLNLGQGQPNFQLPQPPAQRGGFDPRQILQALLQQQPHEMGDARFQQGGFNPGVRPQTGQPVSGGQPWDTHHAMVSAAGNLARFLAQQHTAGLRRFQYNGRN